MNSDFARRQLEKHGWTDGDGLGRKRNGISEPIKVNLKMDKTGVGHDPGKEFTDHWWMKAFNDAAKKTKKANKPQQEEESEENNRKAEMSAKSKNFYKGFVKASTLANGCETKDSDQSSSEEESNEVGKTSVPTLDDLHKFCDGATGHRAARFGIKMKGKLSRVAAHDKEFEEQSKDEPGLLYLKKRKHKSSENVASSDTQVLEGDSDNDKSELAVKEQVVINEAVLNIVTPTAKEKKKKKKRRKNEENYEENQVESSAHRLIYAEADRCEETEKKMKKRKKTGTFVEEATLNASADIGDGENDGNFNGALPDEPESKEKAGSKKKKKNTSTSVEKSDDSIIIGDREIDSNLNGIPSDEPENQGRPGTKQKKKKKKQNASVAEASLNDIDIVNRGDREINLTLNDITSNESESREQKKKKKHDTLVEETALNDNEILGKCDVQIEGNLDDVICDNPENKEQPLFKKKKKRVNDRDDVLPINDPDALLEEKRKKKRKRRAEDCSEDFTNTLDMNNEIQNSQSNDTDEINGTKHKENFKDMDNPSSRKKKKKSRDSKNNEEEVIAMLNNSLETSSKGNKSEEPEKDRNVPENRFDPSDIAKEKKEKQKKKKNKASL